MSTNTSLSFIEMVKIYQLRWCIEVFFKESKQLFGLVSANQLILMLR
jgi:IS4 transposase